ncbi:MAG: glycoside hydrolase family 3 C-terminal domain-containing protein [Clostridia bacterium]|nr:glycoside hydrolase family 3 C-terminal domain-containing protein [Clostridia bacterium]
MDKFARFRYQPCMPLGKDGKRVTASTEHINLSKEAASEGIVLLKNINNCLPLKKGEKVALFGKATIEYIKGGGGSGDVHCPYIRNIFEGFEEKEADDKVEIYRPLIDFYKKYVKAESVNVLTQEQINARWDIVNNMEFCTERDDMTYDTFAAMHVKEAKVPDELIEESAKNAETAIITLSRFSAEGVDRRPIPGDYYLSELEKDLIDKSCKLFKKVIIVINSGATIDCEYFAENDKIGAVLFAWQGGMEGGSAIADVICGDVTPSGKLVDTIAKSYDDFPTKNDFWECFDHLDYSDDIYVGYRYFETIPEAREKVRYPFGFGLSYTSFELSDIMCFEHNNKIHTVVNVKNVGTVCGKEVIQVYYSAPQGKLGKPAKVLAAYSKTKLLSPGETQTVHMTFDIEQMSNFDDLGKIQKSAYILEKGEYSFYVGTSVRDNTKAEFVYFLNENVAIQQLSSLCKPYKLKKRMLSNGTFEELPQGEPSYYYGENTPVNSKTPEDLAVFDKVGNEISMDDFIAQMSIDELAYLVGGQAPTGVANTGCFGGLKRLEIPAIPTADGPAGLRLEPKTGIPTTAWPCATLLACTWNTDLIEKVGAAGGAELRENNLGVWLAPALNIHRDPLCGRNFEYYSEDPLVAGKSAAAAVKGIQSQKVAVSIKHFACNSKEANRFACDSRLSERALREIYLKGFEITVKEADPWTVMSSYNLINGLHTSESWELLTGILRNEWGFKGMVVTDWGVKNRPVVEVKAGNDMKMHCGYPDELKEAYENGDLSRADLELCVKRILEMFNKLA